MPTPDELTGLLGHPQGTAERMTAVLGIVTALAKSYTRGNGWTDGEPAEDIGAVILTATARLITNPGQLVIGEEMGPVSVRRAPFTGWTLIELAVLNRYRDTAV